MTSFIVTAILLTLTPIIIELSSQDIGFGINCVFILIQGTSSSICESALFGLSSTISKKHSNGVMIGINLSGLIITCIRLICLAVFPQDSSGYIKSTCVYFGISAVILVFCVFVQLHIMKNPLVQESILKTNCKEAKNAKVFDENLTKMIVPNEEIQSEGIPKVVFKELFLQI